MKLNENKEWRERQIVPSEREKKRTASKTQRMHEHAIFRCMNAHKSNGKRKAKNALLSTYEIE